MAAQTRDLHIEQGVSFVEVYVWRTVAGRQSLAGWTPRAQIRQHPSGTLLLDLEPHLEVIPDVTDSAGDSNDAIRLNIPGDITRLINAPAKWDLRLVDTAGGEHVAAVVLFRGDITHEKAYTR